MPRRLFVANCGEDTISVVSISAMAEVTKIPLLPPCCGPRRLRASGSAIYHADTFSATVGRISAERPHLQTHAFVGACPTDLVLSRTDIYVACGESNSLWQLDRRSQLPKECVNTGTFPIGLCQNGGLLCSCGLLCGRIDVFDMGLTRLSTRQVEGMPLCVGAYGEDWLVSGIDGFGRGIFLSTGRPEKTVTMSCPGARIAVIEKNAIVTHVWDDSVSLIDLETMELVRTCACGRMPDEICVDPISGKVFISCMLDDTVNVLDQDLELLAEIPVGKEPRGLAVL